MTVNEQPPVRGEAPQGGRGSVVAAWIVAGLSLVLTIVGVFWLRLWLAGLLLGVVALVLALIALRRRRTRGTVAGAVAGALAVAVPAVVGLITLVGWIMGIGPTPERDRFDVALQVTAEGDFTVSYTEPPAPGATKATVTQVDATDDFETSFTTDLDRLQLLGSIAQDNLGPQTIRCTISINGTVVVDKTGDQRSVDCSADLQELYQEQVAPR